MEDKLWKLVQKKAKKNYEMEYGSWEEADKYEREDWVFYEYNKLNEMENKIITLKDLKARKDYSFECNINESYKNFETDEWGCALAWIGDDKGVEYNFCIDSGENCCGIYKMELNEKTNYMETDYEDSIHYEINFDEVNWVEKLENAMCKALMEFFMIA